LRTIPAFFLRGAERTTKNFIQDSRTAVELRTGQLSLMHIRTNFLKHKDEDKVHTVITTYVTFKPVRFRADKNNGVINESAGRTLTRETTFSYYSRQGQRRTPCVVYEQRLFIPVTATKRNQENNSVYFMQDICCLVTKVKSRRLQWAEHVSRMGRTRKGYRILVGKLLPATRLEASKSFTFKSNGTSYTRRL
jgi:hypothetical protein